MKKLKLTRIIAVFIVIAMVLVTLPVCAQAENVILSDPKDWTGYYPIDSIEDLVEKLNEDPYGKYYLICDLSFHSSELQPGGKFYDAEYDGWRPIGAGFKLVSPSVSSVAEFNKAVEKYGALYVYDSTEQAYSTIASYNPSIKEYFFFDAFYGVLDGNGYSIYGLEMLSMNDANGLIGINYGTIHNLSVEKSFVGGYIQTGAICGINYGIISDCYTSGEIYGGGYLGGICGSNYGFVIGCQNNVAITGSAYCGGITGLNCGYVQNCFNFGEVFAVDYAGGIAGIAYNSVITECVGRGYVKTDNGTHGALVGLEDDDGSACNMYRNCIYVSYIDSHTGKKGAASIIKNQTAFNRVSEYYFTSPNYYNDKGFDVGNDVFFDEGGHPRSVIFGEQKDFKCSALWNGILANGFKKGNGSKSNPYVIETAAQLAYFSKRVASGESFEGKYIELCSDIELNDTSMDYWFRNAVEFTPIGNLEAPFAGNFDGKGYTVKGLYCNRSDSMGVGLFGYVSDGSINGVKVDAYIKGTLFVGGICGANTGAVISNCNVTGYVRGIVYTGMICGSNYGEITRSSSLGTAYASGVVGGICGDNVGEITKCSSAARVIGADEGQGGICGENYGNIGNCYNTGEVLGKSHVGGICGINNDGLIENSYQAGKISGWIYTGAVSGSNKITGENPSAKIENCYYLEGTAINFSNKVQAGTGTYMSGSSAQDAGGVTIKCTDEQMKNRDTFTEFDFKKVWVMGEEGYLYPVLRDEPEKFLGDTNGDGVVNSIDANILKRYLTDNTVAIEFVNADMNSDGKVDVIDSNLLKRMIAGSN